MRNASYKTCTQDPKTNFM